jgi:hypothetical protein
MRSNHWRDALCRQRDDTPARQVWPQCYKRDVSALRGAKLPAQEQQRNAVAHVVIHAAFLAEAGT